MPDEKEDLFLSIDHIYENIRLECLDSMFYPPEDYQNSSLRIHNASTLLYIDATQIYNDKEKFGKRSKLNLEQIAVLLRKIWKILDKSETMPEKEDEVKNILDEENLVAEDYLISYQWDGKFIEENYI